MPTVAATGAGKAVGEYAASVLTFIVKEPELLPVWTLC
jgi:hypothetical protein